MKRGKPPFFHWPVVLATFVIMQVASWLADRPWPASGQPLGFVQYVIVLPLQAIADLYLFAMAWFATYTLIQAILIKRNQDRDQGSHDRV
jgi:hypothetical protein